MDSLFNVGYAHQETHSRREQPWLSFLTDESRHYAFLHNLIKRQQ